MDRPVAGRGKGTADKIRRWCRNASDSTVRACRWVWEGGPDAFEESVLSTGNEPAPLDYGWLDGFYTALTRFFTYLAGAALFVIVAVCVIDVVSWKFFDWPFPSQQGLVTYLNVALVFLAVAYVQMDRGSVAIELLQDSFGLRGISKLAVRVFASILGAGISLFCAYRGWYLLADLYRTHASDTGVWHFPIWPFELTMVLGWFLLGVAFLFTIGREVTNYRLRRAVYAPGPAKKDDSSDAKQAAQ